MFSADFFDGDGEMVGVGSKDDLKTKDVRSLRWMSDQPQKYTRKIKKHKTLDSRQGFFQRLELEQNISQNDKPKTCPFSRVGLRVSSLPRLRMHGQRHRSL